MFKMIGALNALAGVQLVISFAAKDIAMWTSLFVLIRMLLEFKTQGFAPLQQRFSQRDAILGQVIGTSDGLQGVCEGVDNDGVLLIATAQGRVKINSAEVSVRPVNAIQGAS